MSTAPIDQLNEASENEEALVNEILRANNNDDWQQ